MNLKTHFVLLVDGEPKGMLQLSIGPGGIGLGISGNIDLQPYEEQPAKEKMAIPDEYMKELLRNRGGVNG